MKPRGSHPPGGGIDFKVARKFTAGCAEEDGLPPNPRSYRRIRSTYRCGGVETGADSVVVREMDFDLVQDSCSRNQ
jgi:hypothetical protein